MAKFTRKTASRAGKLGGKNRWRAKDPATNRNLYLPIRVTVAELEMINAQAEKLNLSRVELIVRAVREYKPPPTAAKRAKDDGGKQ